MAQRPRGRPALLGAGYRHRHSGSATRQSVSGFPARGRVDHAPIRRYRSRVDHLVRTGADDEGTYLVQSIVGEGSTFHFTIRLQAGFGAGGTPARDEARWHLPNPATVQELHPHRPLSPSRRSCGSWSPMTTMRIAAWSTTVLRKRGHVCAEAVNGRQVLDALARPDIRRGVDGRSDARDGRLSGHGRDSQAGVAAGWPRADHRVDGPRHGWRSRTMPARRHGCLPGQAAASHGSCVQLVESVPARA